MFNINSKFSMHCISRLAVLAKCDELFSEHFAMKRCQRKCKKLKHADSHDFAGFMRKIGMKYGNDES